MEWLIGIWDRIRSRPRLCVLSLDDRSGAQHAGYGTDEIVFEVENRGRNQTSLEPLIEMTALSLKGKEIHRVFKVSGDRTLAPFHPKQLVAEDSESIADPSMAHSHYRIYVFRLAHGQGARVRVRHASMQRLGVVRFWIDRFRYKRNMKKRELARQQEKEEADDGR